MTEKMHSHENMGNMVPNEREVLNVIENIIGHNYEVSKKCEDDIGLYLLEARTRDEAGDIVMYNYIRAGTFSEGFSSETLIDIVFYTGDIPVGGHTVARLRDGSWIMEAN